MALSLTTFADYYTDPYYMSSYSTNPTLNFFSLAIAVLMIAALWKVFTKAKQPGWASIVPIYNAYILLKVVNRPGWWLLLYFIPFVNLTIWIVVNYDLSRAFNKGIGTMLLLMFLPFIGYPMLGFGDAKYTPIKR